MKNHIDIAYMNHLTKFYGEIMRNTWLDMVSTYPVSVSEKPWVFMTKMDSNGGIAASATFVNGVYQLRISRRDYHLAHIVIPVDRERPVEVSFYQYAELDDLNGIKPVSILLNSMIMSYGWAHHPQNENNAENQKAHRQRVGEVCCGHPNVL